MRTELMERLIAYAKVNTQSDDASETCPSTPGQWTLLRMLVEELKTIGMQEVTIDGNGYVMATLPANTDKDAPTIGFLAHVDTSPDFTGEGVNPQVVENYDGKDILLNKELNIVLSPNDFPELKKVVGHTLITTDGTTLLGADDKAGVAEIMTAMAYLIGHPEIRHGKIRVAFTPDEEIGRGPHRFDVEAFGAKFAYTMDGAQLGELEFESFNAAEAKVYFHGKNVHPGSAKNKMVNAIKIAMEFQAALPQQEAPEHTEGYEGFYHLNTMQGNVEETMLHYIVRDHDRAKFEARKEKMKQIASELQAKYGAERVELKLKDQYFNMREKIEPVPEIMDVAKAAMQGLGVEPKIKPIRGGTDGSQLSYMGLPTPNIFTGGENYHGRYEYASLDVMELAAKTIVEIARLVEERA
ncbi:peptidase T [Cohnella lubricantis]|uniref:Peptidase T n=1 Tax=Cohnella lubricantis TaxID=2163172 RepID=A0A841TAS1_9BACL|nr:peptidase T [Cohnella lubricantis]MBB6676350.1 peptidase T [Cohnella lubricantis]MBP2120280.1 tripeptide aminopeptidase [Cohnella lubricantis]